MTFAFIFNSKTYLFALWWCTLRLWTSPWFVSMLFKDCFTVSIPVHTENAQPTVVVLKLDMSTARRRLKSPRSLSGTSDHLSISWSWMDDLHPFRSLSIGRPIPEIKLFQTLTLKLQGQGYGCGQRARSYNRPSITLKTSKVKVMSGVKGQGHILYPVSNQCTSFSFHIHRTNHSWDMAKIVFDLEKTHPKFLEKICQNNSFQQISPKSNQVIIITRATKLPRFVVIQWTVLT